MNSIKECYKGCGQKNDLRPYGPRGEWVCFKCALATPEDKAATEAAFGSQLNSAIDAGNGIAIAGSEVGPYPYTGPRCQACGAVEVDAMTPATVYACGSRDYDQRPGTFKQSEQCKAASKEAK